MIFIIFRLFAVSDRNQLGNPKGRDEEVTDKSFVLELLQYKTWWAIEEHDSRKQHHIVQYFSKRVKPPADFA